MSDPLGALLERTADDWCRGAQPPPLESARLVPQRRRMRGGRLVRFAPVLAAAAVVAVVVPTVLVAARHAGPRAIEQVGNPLPVQQGPALRFQDDDAGLPALGMPGPDPNLPDCTTQQLAAVLDLAAGVVRVDLKTPQVCLLPEVRVTLPDSVAVVSENQPKVPNPPEFAGRFLEQGRSLALNARWAGRCDALPDRGEILGHDLDVPLTVTGTPTSCSDGRPTLTLGPAHPLHSPGAIVPTDRADLVVSLQLPAEVASGGAFPFTATLANPTEHAVSLRPCPTFSQSYRMDGGGGEGGYGRVPCEQLPERLESRQSVVLEARGTTMTEEPAATETRSTARLTWGIAGTSAATASFAVVRRVPKPAGVVPYKAPTGEAAVKSTYRYDNGSGGGRFPIEISGPATVRAGETLHYKATFTNPGGGPVVPLRPCPYWTETMAQAPKVTNRPKVVERSGAVNCAQAPEQVGPGEQIVFEMERTIGPDTPPGAYQIYWQIHNGLVSAPFDIDVVP